MSFLKESLLLASLAGVARRNDVVGNDFRRLTALVTGVVLNLLRFVVARRNFDVGDVGHFDAFNDAGVVVNCRHNVANLNEILPRL